MNDHYETRCPSCGGSDEQGCYPDCPSSEVARLAARIEQLEAVVLSLEAAAIKHHQENVARAEWGGSDMAHRKAKAVLSRSGMLLCEIRSIARAALEGK